MDGHLVSVEVCIEGCADERMELDGFSFYEYGFEGLDAEPVQSRRAVEHYGVFPHDFVQGVPDFRGFPFHEFFGGFYGGNQSFLFQPVIDKGLEEFQSHFFWQTALVQTQVGSCGDDGTTAIVHPFAQQVLAEASLFSFQSV